MRFGCTLSGVLNGAALLLIAARAPAFAQNGSPQIQKMAERVVAAYNARDYATIFAQLNTPARAKTTVDALTRFYDGLHASAGKLTSLGKPELFGDGIAVYPADFERRKMELLIAVDDAGRIQGLEINEKASRSSRNKTPLRLPFNGEWVVLWGGDTPEVNYHQAVALSRFAFDFVKVDAAGKQFTGDGSRNEDFSGFGQEILAPADGVVTDVISGVRDNVPGVVNNFADIGNMVMVRHPAGEVSVFGHLKLGSIRVAVGQRVTKGQVLGLSGNSGNSILPHLHYQLQRSEIPQRESTITVFFEDIAVRHNGNAEVKREYSPVKGDIVRVNR